jgi:hypothetical protein
VELPATVDRNTHASVGAALAVADKLTHTGNPLLASAVHNAANSAFFQGFHAANYVAAGIAAAGAVVALVLLPAQPTTGRDDTPAVPAPGAPATSASLS